LAGRIVVDRAERIHRMPPDYIGDLGRSINRARLRGGDVIDLTGEVVRGIELAPPGGSFAGVEDRRLDIREEVADYYESRFQVILNPEREVYAAVDARRIASDICLTFVNPGDVVLVPDPGLPYFRSAAILAGGKPVSYYLYERNDFLPNLESIDGEVAREAKLMFLSYPNNPTGAIADLPFFEELVDFALRHNIILVNDLSYGLVTYDEHLRLSLMQVKEARHLALEYGGFDKPFGPEWAAAGYVVGGRELIAGLEFLQATTGATDSGCSPTVVGFHPFNFSPAASDGVMELQRRRDLVVEKLRMLGWAIRRPHGAIFVWFKVPGRYSSIGFVRMCLRRTDVALMPGSVFGELGESYVRLSLVEDMEVLARALTRLSEDIPLWVRVKKARKRGQK